MTRISEILKNSTATKVKGHLKDDMGANGGNRYCALGVLGCEAGLLPQKIVSGTESLYEEILRKYDISSDTIYINFSEELGFIFDGVTFFSPRNLHQLIYGLNDCTEMSFKEIGEFLETNLGL